MMIPANDPAPFVGLNSFTVKRVRPLSVLASMRGIQRSFFPAANAPVCSDSNELVCSHGNRLDACALFFFKATTCIDQDAIYAVTCNTACFNMSGTMLCSTTSTEPSECWGSLYLLPYLAFLLGSQRRDRGWLAYQRTVVSREGEGSPQRVALR